eukprot:TRINITY_DN55973_c0_g1_i1.p1 TRINITY_DN55973_c0_g1~~TRINITY_DN55973_c0_g1_i1.p1  ORF type:complete len:208 (-),score=16.89 TRINITY_DN55973_c0_g1_i1:19-642(-)
MEGGVVGTPNDYVKPGCCTPLSKRDKKVGMLLFSCCVLCGLCGVGAAGVCFVGLFGNLGGPVIQAECRCISVTTDGDWDDYYTTPCTALVEVRHNNKTWTGTLTIDVAGTPAISNYTDLSLQGDSYCRSCLNTVSFYACFYEKNYPTELNGQTDEAFPFHLPWGAGAVGAAVCLMAAIATGTFAMYFCSGRTLFRSRHRMQYKPLLN